MKAREVLRAIFNKLLDNLQELVQEESPKYDDIRISIELLENKLSEISIADERIFNDMVNSDAKVDEITTEVNEADEFRSKFIKMRNCVVRMLNVVDRPNTAPPANSAPAEKKTKTYKLPVIELQKFSGEVREWLQFWSQFKKIHEDPDMSKEDKFQYLMQAMVPGSRALELVQSFPPTGENYEKVISSLKSRFGRDELQVEVYVRELLKLVLQNALKPKEKMPLSSLYDKIESHLRALETLGVTTDMCAAMLFPLVESSLPEELLRAWQRSSMGNNTAVAKDRLAKLIEFCKQKWKTSRGF